MKFIINREDLLKPLQQVNSSLNNRLKIPVLNNLLIQVKDNTLSLTVTDLEIEMISYILLSQPYEIGTTTVPARKFFDICRSLPEKAEITVELEDEYILIRSGRSFFSLSTLPAYHFPNLENWKSEVEFILSQSTIKYLIEATHFSMANQDVRYYLNGMLFETEDKELRSVATDGHRLAICKIFIDKILPHHSIIVSRKGITELMRILRSNNRDLLHIKVDSKNICIYTEEFSFTSKLIDGQFPDYRRVLLKDTDKMLEVDCNILKKAFSRVSILSNEKSRGVRLYMNDNQLKITADNLEKEKAEETIDVTYVGKEIEISLNVNYILDVLNVLKCEDIRILLNSPTSSIQIKDVKNENKTYVIMPMRI